MVMFKKELFVKIHEFVISASKLLYSFIEKGEEVPYTVREKYEVKKSGSWSMTYIEQPLTIGFVWRHEKDLRNLPEFETCTKLMQAEPQISKHLDKLVGYEGGSKIRRTVWDFLYYFLLPMFEKYFKEQRFDQQLLEKLYYEFERFLTNDQIFIRDFAYLDNFDGDIGRINIEKGLVIRKVTNKESEKFLERPKWMSSTSFRMIPPKYVIETRYARRKVIGSGKEQPSISVGKLLLLVTALRLFKSGVMGFNEIGTAPETPFLWGHTASSGTLKTFIGPKYFLAKKEISQFRDFWKKFSTFYTSKPKRFAIAVSRFQNAYEKVNPNDKLIDYMIAYEALFFKQGETGEFRHKLSTRVSKLLGKTYEDRKMIAKEINEFYIKRSKIVHGEEVKLPRGLIDKVESYLRNSIKILMERLPEQGYDEIISHLDLD